MLLIDSLYINNSGGKVLLDYLIEELEKTGIPILYLLDERIKNNHPTIKPENKVYYLKGNLFLRHLFYLKHRKEISKVLCFANLPPTLKLKAEILTYFHQPLFIRLPNSAGWKLKLIIAIKSNILKLIVKNTNKWAVQSVNVQNKLSAKFNIFKDDILILPFYPPMVTLVAIPQKINSFIYVSNGSAHKNHANLLKAFSSFYKLHQIGELHLTISSSFIELSALIESYIKDGIPIVNHGNIERSELTELYHGSEFSIYPSLTESLGLGIIEALECGCKIIGADRPYMHAVCEPSVIFDPLSVESIIQSIEKAVFTDCQPSKQKVFNEIDSLINLLK